MIRDFLTPAFVDWAGYVLVVAVAVSLAMRIILPGRIQRRMKDAVKHPGHWMRAGH